MNDSFRLVVLGGSVVVLLLGGLLTWLMLVSRPAVARYESGLAQLEAQHAGMLDQETGLRAYLSTGNSRFLQPYYAGQAEQSAADAGLLDLTAQRQLTAALVHMRLAEQRWLDQWAAPALHSELRFAIGSNDLENFLTAGKTLFDQYRIAHTEAVDSTTSSLTKVRDEQFTGLTVVTGAAVLLSLGKLGGSVLVRRRLAASVLAPVTALLDGLRAVQQGIYDQQLSERGPHELRQLAVGFNQMTTALAASHDEARRQTELADARAERLRAVLTMVREIGGSLNLKYVLNAVTSGVAAITRTDVKVWLVGTDIDSLDLAASANAFGTSPPVAAGNPPSAVVTAAEYGRTTAEPDAADGTTQLGVPLIIGARIVGVLDLCSPAGQSPSAEEVTLLETLSVHAAAAVEAARLHERASHAGDHDALTGLANRRRLDADLQLESDRSLRYGNPLSLLMLDLDHFKRLNDTYGHQRGDEVLQHVATVITGALRATDSAYRYGGEELALLLRETDTEGAAVLAERIRATIEASYPARGITRTVTASVGVACLPSHAADATTLVSAADAALYSAKHAGRNRVHLADTAVGDRGYPAVAVAVE